MGIARKKKKKKESNNYSNMLQNKVLLEPEMQQSNMFVAYFLGGRKSSGCDWEEEAYAMEM